MLRLIVSTAVFCLVIFLLQDFIIFPAASPGIFGKEKRASKLPSGIKSFSVDTTDGETLEVWEHSPETVQWPEVVAILFHGNGATVEGFLGYQRWLGSLGIKSYSFDYRGFGQSSGWPSEKGLYRDGDAVWDFVRKREGEKVEYLIFGVSIGSGPAAHLASKIQPAALMLLAGYSSLPEVARTRFAYRYLAWMLRYEFPVARYVSTLKSSCLLLAHGKNDTIIPFDNLERIRGSYRGDGDVSLVISERSGHNDLINNISGSLGKALQTCLNGKGIKRAPLESP